LENYPDAPYSLLLCYMIKYGNVDDEAGPFAEDNYSEIENDENDSTNNEAQEQKEKKKRKKKLLIDLYFLTLKLPKNKSLDLLNMALVTNMFRIYVWQMSLATCAESEILNQISVTVVNINMCSKVKIVLNIFASFCSTKKWKTQLQSLIILEGLTVILF